MISFNVTDVDSLQSDVEDFESMATTTSTSASNVLGKMAYWSFTKSNVSAPGSDKANGSHSVAMKLPAAIVSSPTYYDAYEVSLRVFNPLNSACKFTLYTSTDGGAQWTVAKTGSGANSAEVPAKTTEDLYWSVNTSQDTGVKYRIVLSSGSRTSAVYIDDFTIYYGEKGTNPSPLKTIESVAFADSVYTVNVGESLALKPVVRPADANNQVMTWTSSATGVANVASGTVKGVAVGTTTITATTTDGSNLTASCKVNVVRLVTSLALNHDALMIPQGVTTQLQATVRPTNATNRSLTWTTSDPAVVKVDTAGLVTAVATGSAYVKVATTDGSNLADSCWFTVTAAATNYLAPSSASYVCQAGATLPVAVAMTNVDSISRAHMRLTLPAGLTLAVDTAGNAVVTGSSRFAAGQSVTASAVNSTTWAIDTRSDSASIAFTGNAGDLVVFNLVAGQQSGTYTLLVGDGVLYPVGDGVPFVSPAVQFTVTVQGGSQLKGDINGDGVVNVTDATSLVNVILGQASYPTSVCDLNADGVVNVTDVTALVNIILAGNK